MALWWGWWWPPPRGLMPYPGLLDPEPLLPQQSTADPYRLRRHPNTILSQSLWCLLVLVHTRYVWALWVSLAGREFDSKCDFAPSTILLGLLHCPWKWDSWLNIILGVSVRVFLDEINNWIRRLSKADCPPQQGEGGKDEMVKDREAWHAAVHVVTKTRIWVSNWMMTTRNEGEITLTIF